MIPAVAKKPRRTRAAKARGWRARALKAIRNSLIGAGVGVVLLTAVPLAYLRYGTPWFSTFMLRSHFSDPATGEACKRVEYRWAPWDSIASPMRRAVVVAEDQRFLEHDGFDLNAIEQAVSDRLRGERLRGASTISQQLVKNLFLWPGRSVIRKGLEVWYTGWIELAWPKHRILELYLNVAQFGPCRFGVESAAAHFFSTTAARLRPDEAALLAATLPNPAKIRADEPGPYAQQRSREILQALAASRDASWLRGL